MTRQEIKRKDALSVCARFYTPLFARMQAGMGGHLRDACGREAARESMSG